VTEVRLDPGFFQNPKIRAIQPRARALYLGGLCWTAAHDTKGFIAAGDLPDVAHQVQVRGRVAVGELEETGLWVRSLGGWTIPGFVEREEMLEQGRQRTRRWRQRNKSRDASTRVTDASQPASQPASQGLSRDASRDKGHARARGGLQNPNQSADNPSSSSGLTSTAREAGNAEKDDLEINFKPEEDDEEEESSTSRVEAALGLLADHDLEQRQNHAELAPVLNEMAWRATALARRQRDDRARLNRLAARHPTLDASELTNAVLIRDTVTDTHPSAGRTSSPEQEAFRAQVARNRRRAAGEACDHCDDTGWVIDDTGAAHPCHCDSRPFTEEDEDPAAETFDSYEPVDEHEHA
jgi:hypothetical protein